MGSGGAAVMPNEYALRPEKNWCVHPSLLLDNAIMLTHYVAKLNCMCGDDEEYHWSHTTNHTNLSHPNHYILWRTIYQRPEDVTSGVIVPVTATLLLKAPANKLVAYIVEELYPREGEKKDERAKRLDLK